MRQPACTDSAHRALSRRRSVAWERSSGSTGGRSSTSRTSSSAGTTKPRISRRTSSSRSSSRCDTFDRRANFQTWLISVSRNLCIDHYRSVRKERETIDRDVDAGELTPASRRGEPVRRARAARPRGAAAPGARRAARRRCGRRSCCATSQELSYQEIADQLRLPEGTVKSRINRGRTELARQIRAAARTSRPAARRRGAPATARPRDGSHRMNLHYRPRQRHRRRARRRSAADVSAALRLLDAVTALIAAGEREILIDLSPVELRRQRDDRLPHGSVPPGQRRRRPSSCRACRSASRRC